MVIKDAFLDLSKTIPYGSLTITDICRRAEISRSTFYIHYGNVHDVLSEVIDDALERVGNLMQQFSQQFSQSILAKPIVFIVQNIALPVVNFVQNIPKFVQNIKMHLPDITDKLCAVFGEAKAFIGKKLDQILNMTKSLTSWLFKIFKKRNTDDEDTKIDDDKKIFNLKTIIHKIKEKFSSKKDKQK